MDASDGFRTFEASVACSWAGEKTHVYSRVGENTHEPPGMAFVVGKDTEQRGNDEVVIVALEVFVSVGLLVAVAVAVREWVGTNEGVWVAVLDAVALDVCVLVLRSAQ